MQKRKKASSGIKIAIEELRRFADELRVSSCVSRACSHPNCINYRSHEEKVRSILDKVR